MILKKQPSVPVKFPPPRYKNEHKVRAGENWQKIAAQYGIGDVWDLIEFNFVTRDPMEVNWYLEMYVGCSRSEDGKNYRFDVADNPGVVYIPTSDWSPDDDVRMRRLVVNAVSGAVLARLQVQYANQILTGRDLAWVGNRVIDRGIRVVFDSSLGSNEAEYIAQDADTMKLGFRTASTWTRKGLIVHEAVHAALDLKSAQGMTIAQSEALAYVVQCYYVRAHTISDTRLVDEDPKKDRVYELAWMMAGHLLEFQQPEGVEWLALENAVRSHPTYRRTAGQTAIFDGV